MKRVSLAVLSLLGLAGVAAPARADDSDFGLRGRDRRARDGDVGVDVDRMPRSPAAPMPRYVHPVEASPSPVQPFDGGTERDFRRARSDRDDRGFRDFRGDREFRPAYVPGHFEMRREVVCEPAIYEDRLVPIFEDRCVPVFGEVSVPVFDDRLVPTFEVVLDRRSGRPHRVQVGVRTERVQVGTRLERVRVGERHEQVEVGTRTERVLVRAEARRVVEREEWVPGRYLSRMPGDHDRHAFDRR